MNKKESEHMSLVAGLGCIVCRNERLGNTPAEIHHTRKGNGLSMRASHFSVLPLCPYHHRTGGHGNAFHSGRKTWERKYGSEKELLSEVDLILREKKSCKEGIPKPKK
jgi:hypothetical protein